MLTITFSPDALRALEYERLHHPHPRVQQKMWTVWLKACDVPHQQICRLMSITENTIRAYLKEFADGGVDGLKRVMFEGTKSKLDTCRGTLESYFREHPPASAAEARAEIARLTGIERSPTQVREFMNRLGMKFRKVAAVPAKVNPAVQETFLKTT
jgi:transposase